MQDSPQQRVVNLKRHCRQIHEGVCRAQRTLSTAKGKVATATFRLSAEAEDWRRVRLRRTTPVPRSGPLPSPRTLRKLHKTLDPTLPASVIPRLSPPQSPEKALRFPL